MLTSFQALILEPGVGDSEEAMETTAFFFLQTRQVEDSGVESVPGRSQGVLLCYNFTVWKETMSSPFTGPVAP